MTPIPAPASLQRDAAGRLVGLVFASTPAPPAVPARRWLLAIDSSANGLRAVDHAVRLAAEMRSVALHLAHIEAWLSKEAAETELAHRGWAVSAEARDRLDQAGLPWQLHLQLGEPSSGLLQLAERLDCSDLFLGSRGLGVAESLLLGSVAYKVLHLAGRPVVVVP